MYKLTLLDGTQFDLDWCNGDKGIFHANLITDLPFPIIAEKFFNKENTAVLKVELGEDVRTYEGYVNLESVNVDGWRTGTTLVTLKQPILYGNPNQA